MTNAQEGEASGRPRRNAEDICRRASHRNSHTAITTSQRAVHQRSVEKYKKYKKWITCQGVAGGGGEGGGLLNN